jgi:hypothetical protein
MLLSRHTGTPATNTVIYAEKARKRERVLNYRSRATQRLLPEQRGSLWNRKGFMQMQQQNRVRSNGFQASARGRELRDEELADVSGSVGHAIHMISPNTSNTGATNPNGSGLNPVTNSPTFANSLLASLLGTPGNGFLNTLIEGDTSNGNTTPASFFGF